MPTQKVTRFLFFLSLLPFYVLTACSQGDAPSSGAASVEVRLKLTSVGSNKTLVSKTRRKAPSEEVQSVRVEVTTNTGEPATTPKVENVTPNEPLSVELDDVATGFQRTFTVEAFSGENGEGDVVFKGQDTVDLFSGESVEITIEMARPSESISVTPKETVVNLLGDAVFSADVTALSDPALEWSVNDHVKGNAVLGTLAVEGNTATYTAPSAFPGSNVVTIKARSVADRSLFGTAT
ncbi:MAG: hypothetical protein ACE5F7_10430, partial [Nitrospiria bacterium]